MCSGVALFEVDDLKKQIAALAAERDALIEVLTKAEKDISRGMGNAVSLPTLVGIPILAALEDIRKALGGHRV